MDIRAYRPDDRDACLAIFDSNTPDYFRPEERAEFAAFLENPRCSYVVMEHEGAIVGCGGFHVRSGEPAAHLTWGIVRRELHRKGLGRFLLLYRLREIGKADGVQMVLVATSQLTAPFFESQGFKVMSVRKGGYAPGLDRVDMVMKLAVCP